MGRTAYMAALVRSVGFREQEGTLSCVVGFGSDAWDQLFGKPRPRDLHKFREIRAGERHAVSTPGDVLFHIRAQRMDLCFELATQITARLGRSEEHTSELQSLTNLVCRLLLEKKKKKQYRNKNKLIRSSK